MPSPGQIAAKVRASTRQCHESLDRDPRISSCFESKEGLAFLLGRWYGFLVPYEIRLAAMANQWDGFVASRRKTHLLIDDLRAHGIQLKTLPFCPSVPELTSEAEMMGAMYVTEGSTLGGRFIARRLEEVLGVSGNFGYSFFNAYGEQTGSRWKDFLAVMDEVCSDAPSSTVDAALRTFNCIHRWLAVQP